MSITAKIILVLTGLAWAVLLGTADPGRIAPQTGGKPEGLHGFERFRLQPREVSRAVPVMAPESRMDAVEPQIRFWADPPVPKVRGVYVTSWSAGRPGFLTALFDFTRKTGINALVIDVKDDTGYVSYPSEVWLAREIKAGISKYHPAEVLNLLRERQLYPIARIVVFKDPLLAAAKPDWAVQDRRGGLWSDHKGRCWVDPYNHSVWEYNVALAKEAAKLGFREIQFDYVRFTSDGKIANCLYPGADARTHAEVIRDFLRFAYGELKGYGVKVAADVFGLTCSAEDDLGIGQQFEYIAANVDVICPMVYPSHYRKGSYQLANPDRNPYETVYRSLADAKRKCNSVPNEVVVRPWLQDFSLMNRYSSPQLQAQVRAVAAAGFEEWIFWNPTNRYDEKRYRFVPETPEPIPAATEIPDE
jgi:hypothetical protein